MTTRRKGKRDGLVLQRARGQRLRYCTAEKVILPEVEVPSCHPNYTSLLLQPLMRLTVFTDGSLGLDTRHCRTLGSTPKYDDRPDPGLSSEGGESMFCGGWEGGLRKFF